MIVAQYSVHAIAGLKPDYGIHFPNIRSPEGWQKDNVRSSGVTLQPKGRLFRKGCQIGFTRTRGNNLNRPWQTVLLFYATSLKGLLKFFYYFNLSRHARLIFKNRLTIKRLFYTSV
jgi:hypothetical protein